MTVNHLETGDANLKPGTTPEQEKLVVKFLEDTNKPVPQTVAAKGSPDFFTSGNFEGNMGDLMMAAMNDPGRFYNDPYFQALLRAQQGTPKATDTLT